MLSIKLNAGNANTTPDQDRTNKPRHTNARHVLSGLSEHPSKGTLHPAIVFNMLRLSSLFPLLISVLSVRAVVYDPRITYPDSSAVWTAGRTELVKWDTTGVPTGYNGSIHLGYLAMQSEHIMPMPLANDLDLSIGRAMVSIPSNLTTRNDYIIILFGDSGNISPDFTIQGVNPQEITSGNAVSYDPFTEVIDDFDPDDIFDSEDYDDSESNDADYS